MRYDVIDVLKLIVVSHMPIQQAAARLRSVARTNDLASTSGRLLSHLGAAQIRPARTSLLCQPVSRPEFARSRLTRPTFRYTAFVVRLNQRLCRVCLWLKLVSHRMFMPNLLNAKQHKGWPPRSGWLCHLPFPRAIYVFRERRHPTVVRPRALPVLLHDFPEFLCEFYFSFCDVIRPIASSCATWCSPLSRARCASRSFHPNLKVDLLPEIALPGCSGIPGGTREQQLKNDIDAHIKKRAQCRRK